jgi:hypothetical protein
MQFHIGLEDGDENRSIAWILGQPGCFAYGADPEAALSAVPQAIREYSAWVGSHEENSWVQTDDFQVKLDETWEVYHVNEEYERVEHGYSINAWFFNDWKALSELEIERGLKLLSWSRADLLQSVAGLDREVLERSYPGERWSISGVLQHVANAEWWYMDRLDLAFPRKVLHNDPYERLEKVRAFLIHVLPTLAGSTLVKGTDAEFWSPRKLLRRSVWHERDHTQHIRKLIESVPD